MSRPITLAIHTGREKEKRICSQKKPDIFVKVAIIKKKLTQIQYIFCWLFGFLLLFMKEDTQTNYLETDVCIHLRDKRATLNSSSNNNNISPPKIDMRDRIMQYLQQPMYTSSTLRAIQLPYLNDLKCPRGETISSSVRKTKCAMHREQVKRGHTQYIHKQIGGLELMTLQCV